MTAMEETKHYFAYGSNMDINQLRDRLQKTNIPYSLIAYLPDYKLVFSRNSTKRGGGVASIQYEKGERVYGVVFGLTDQDFYKLDVHEGYHPGLNYNAYERVTVNIYDLDNVIFPAQTYIANKTGKHKPSKEYLQIIIKGAEDNKLPTEYIEKLKRIQIK